MTTNISIYNNGIPGVVQSYMLHEIAFRLISLQTPPAASSTDLVRICIWVPLPQVAEQSELDIHSFHIQFTTYFSNFKYSFLFSVIGYQYDKEKIQKWK